MNLAISFGLLLGLLVLPILVSGCLPDERGGVPWYEARRNATGLLPIPATTPEAVIQIYAARVVSWRGVFAVHTWLALKPTGAERYTRYEVLGFGVANGAPALRVDRMGPDNYWFGARPQILLDRRGPGVDAMIDNIRSAIAAIPIRTSVVPGPVPTATRSPRILPVKSPNSALTYPRTPSARTSCPQRALCFRAQRLRISGFALQPCRPPPRRRRRVRAERLGLNIGVDAAVPALKLPGIGRLGLER